MKSFNQIIIKGTVGSLRINKVGERHVANFSVATEYDFKNKDGSWAKETVWHSVSAWQWFGICDFDKLEKGAKVLVVGRIRNRKYTDQSGTEKEVTEVLAETLDVLAPEKPSTKAVQGAGNGKGYADEDEF